jgi:hypothetical protein
LDEAAAHIEKLGIMDALVAGDDALQPGVRAETIQTAKQARLAGLAGEDFAAGEAVEGIRKPDS